jgi:predicted PurR-regulated permease PerM
MSPYLAGIFVIGATLATGVAIVNALVEPFSALVERAPDMVNALTQIISPILRPLTNIRHALASAPGAAAPAAAIGGETDWLVAFLGRLTPALGQLMIFFASLAFFVSGRSALRRQLIMSMPERASRLSAIRAIAAVEQALSHYFGATTLIYVAVAALTGLVAWVGGLPSPLLWMAMTFIASYIPYFGVAIIALALAASGFLAHPHSLMALPPAAGYLVLHLSSETFIIPTLLGRRHEINPFVIFISIVFWSWMWGPVGAILASPLLLSAQTVIGLLSEPEGYLP